MSAEGTPEPIDALASALGGARGHTRVELDFREQDRPFHLHYSPPARHVPPSIRVSTRVPLAPEASAAGPYRDDARPPVENPAPLVLRPETGFDRFGKRIGVDREVQTGDAPFDRRVYVEDEGPHEATVALLGSPSLRQAIVALLDARAFSLRLEPTGLLTAHVPSPKLAQLEPERVRRIARLVGDAASALPPLLPARKRLLTRTRLLATAGIASFALFATAVALSAAWSPLGDLTARAAVFGLIAWIASIALFLAILRGRPSALRTLLLLAFFSLYGALGAADTALLAGSFAFTSSPPTRHVTSIVRKVESHGRTSYYGLDVRGFVDGRDLVRIPVDLPTYRRLNEGEEVVVTTVHGRLGWDRLVSVEPATSVH